MKSTNKEDKLVYFEWFDAASRNGWEDEEEMMEFSSEPSYLVHQVGWIYEEDEEKIVVYSQYHDWKNGKRKGKREYGNCQYVPKGWIRNRKDLT